MGTNYYWHKVENKCGHCNRCDETVLHIGKSSGGWCFALRINPEKQIYSIKDWLILFNIPDSFIKDEYDRIVSVEEMLKCITERSWGNSNSIDDALWLARNQAERGPNNLARHKIGNHCTGHGDGTFDYILGNDDESGW